MHAALTTTWTTTPCTAAGRQASRWRCAGCTTDSRHWHASPCPTALLQPNVPLCEWRRLRLQCACVPSWPQVARLRHDLEGSQGALREARATLAQVGGCGGHCEGAWLMWWEQPGK